LEQVINYFSYMTVTSGVADPNPVFVPFFTSESGI